MSLQFHRQCRNVNNTVGESKVYKVYIYIRIPHSLALCPDMSFDALIKRYCGSDRLVHEPAFVYKLSLQRKAREYYTVSIKKNGKKTTLLLFYFIFNCLVSFSFVVQGGREKKIQLFFQYRIVSENTIFPCTIYALQLYHLVYNKYMDFEKILIYFLNLKFYYIYFTSQFFWGGSPLLKHLLLEKYIITTIYIFFGKKIHFKVGGQKINSIYHI